MLLAAGSWLHVAQHTQGYKMDLMRNGLRQGKATTSTKNNRSVITPPSRLSINQRATPKSPPFLLIVEINQSKCLREGRFSLHFPLWAHQDTGAKERSGIATAVKLHEILLYTLLIILSRMSSFQESFAIQGCVSLLQGQVLQHPT